MAESGIDNLISNVPQSDIKRQKLIECVFTGNSKLYLGKAHTEELSDEKVDKLFSNYEAKLSDQMVKSLGKPIINMYSMGACAAVGINDQDGLSEDLENDPFLNSALQRFTCELYYRYGSFLTPLGVGLITSRHYLSECSNKNGGDDKSDEQKTPVSTKALELMIGFWLGIGVILAVKMVQSLEDCIDELISRKCKKKWQKRIK